MVEPLMVTMRTTISQSRGPGVLPQTSHRKTKEGVRQSHTLKDYQPPLQRLLWRIELLCDVLEF